MITIDDKKKCCGCSACYNICPKGCIEMTPDMEGFVYPIVDTQKCIECGLCQAVCPILNKKSTESECNEAYITRSNDMQSVASCTSGGFVDALNSYIVEHGGVVAGVAFDDCFMPVHKFGDCKEDIVAFRGSKYAQSELGDIFKEIKDKLEKEILVAFIGTPCQVEGLKSYLRKDYENLITVDLVCRSIPSPALWEKYIEWQQKRYKSTIKNVNCRSKTYGYHSGALTIEFDNGKRYAGSNRVDLFMKSFHHDVCSRPSCYDCRFKTIDRCSDYTVYDCWYPEKISDECVDDDKGYSNIIVHTNKGKDYLEKLDLTIYKSDLKKSLSYTGGMAEKSINMPESRKSFYTDLEELGIEKCCKKHVSITKKDILIEKTKPIFYRSGLLKKVKNFGKGNSNANVAEK